MKTVKVLLSSGDEDIWVEVADAFEDSGSMIIVADIAEDEVPENMRTVVLGREIDNGPDLPPSTKFSVYEVRAVYAPGMWMRVEYNHAGS